MLIAVDGPAASGKGTIAQALAGVYAIPYLDTGVLYRAVGVLAWKPDSTTGEPDDFLLRAAGVAEGLESRGLLDDPLFRTREAGGQVEDQSKAALFPTRT